MFLQTERLLLRRVRPDDRETLREVFQDPAVMYAWEHPFSDEELEGWIDRTLARYEADGFGQFFAAERDTGRFAGVIGILSEEMAGRPLTGVGWMLPVRCQGRGLATEGARGCIEWVFANTGAPCVAADIRPENLPSRRVAERLGMRVTGAFIKHYYGMEMPHLIYELSREAFLRQVHSTV